MVKMDKSGKPASYNAGPGKQSKKSGRTSPTITTDSAWLYPAFGELNGVFNKAMQSTAAQHHGEIEFAILWAGNWLLSYDAGHCSLRDLLVATKNGSARVPAPWNRLILGVVAHKATLSTPQFLGEHRAKTVPGVVRMVGSLVQSRLFDEEGKQALNLDEAVAAAISFLGERKLLEPLPVVSTVKGWHKEWRNQEIAAGITVPTPSVGRPKKISN